MLFNKLVEATIEIYVNYLLGIFIGCDVPSNGITPEKGSRELLGQISLIVERGGQQCLGKWCFPFSGVEIIDYSWQEINNHEWK